MRSVIATEVIPNIMHARSGGRVLGQLGGSVQRIGRQHRLTHVWARTQVARQARTVKLSQKAAMVQAVADL